jgi:hypothetical protein
MALMSGVLETGMRALGTLEPGCTSRPARLSLCLRITSHKKSQGMRWQHQSPLSREAGSETVGHETLWSPPLQGSRIRSCRTRGAPEISPVGRRGPKLWYMWWRWSPFYQRGGIRSQWTRGSPRAHLGWEVGSGAAGHVTVCGCMPHFLS